jgi:hypothetical protein
MPTSRRQGENMIARIRERNSRVNRLAGAVYLAVVALVSLSIAAGSGFVG